ncbi:hypothetical protein HOLleu_26015 [Holothuria leucospilota]|uniref:Uncharacterized protein n=1 Tax=Holothuria leucospilota TaxID=206669 RepID=A0A9Q1BTP9_HOLLE|nr:hypothetical protein HOLleu_26015 [Holothuria leucospilota]
MDIARTYESTRAHMEELSKGNGNVSYVKHNQELQYGKCGLKHPKGQCPAHGSTCRYCGKINHCKSVCRQPKQKEKACQSSGTKQSRKRSRSKGRSVRNYQSGPKSDSAKQVDSKNQGDGSLSSTFEELRFDTLDFVSVNSVNKGQDQRSEIFADVHVKLDNRAKGVTLRLKVDTGAQRNILSLRVYKKMYPDRITGSGFPQKDAPSKDQQLLRPTMGRQFHNMASVKFRANMGTGILKQNFFCG